MSAEYIHPLQGTKRLHKIGNKAKNLRFLNEKGFPIPATYVCTWDAYASYLQDEEEHLVEVLKTELASELDLSKRFAVRSSGNLEVGRSDHRQMHTQMMNSLEEAFRAEGDETTQFYLSFLDDDPRPDAAVIQALNDGASRIIVSEVFLTISNHTAEGKNLIEELNVEEELGVPVLYTGPMYDSSTLQSMFVQRANAHMGDTDKSKVGILLVGHGQPDEWDVEWATETEQEIGFRQNVLQLLEDDGYSRENLSLAWMEFKEPKPADKVEEFAESGVEKVLYFSAAISADALHSQYDVPALVNEARVPDTIPLINLGAWNDDPIVIQAIKEKIDRQLGAFAQSQ